MSTDASAPLLRKMSICADDSGLGSCRDVAEEPQAGRSSSADAKRRLDATFGMNASYFEDIQQLAETNLQFQQRSGSEPKRRYRDSYSPPGKELDHEYLRADRASGCDGESPLRPASLTRNNLALFDNLAKKGTTSHAARSTFPEFSRPESPQSWAPSSAKSFSSTSSTFADQVYKNGILHPCHSKPPSNLQFIRERLNIPRVTASPSGSVYERYVNDVEVAPNEATMAFKVGGKLLKEPHDSSYHQVFNQEFTGFPREVGFNDGVSAPQPDFVEGLRKREFSPVPVDALYEDDPSSLALPHLAGEWKGRGKSMDEARLQSAFTGAALVYARKQALAQIGTSDPPGHSEVMTFTTDGTNVNMFAHYATSSEDGMLKYHQYPIQSTNLVASHQGLKDGRRGLRNGQDYAREQSYILKNQLRAHWLHCHDLSDSVTEGRAESLPDLEPSKPSTRCNREVKVAPEMVVEPREQAPPSLPKSHRASEPAATASPRSSFSRSHPPEDTNSHITYLQKRKAPFTEISASRSPKIRKESP